MPDIRPGPYQVIDSSAALKLEGSTVQIVAGDGSVVLAGSTQGTRAQRDQIEAAAGVAVDALNGGASDDDEGSDVCREALESILSDDVTSAKAAKELARWALGDE